jgi:hypothetical protein
LQIKTTLMLCLIYWLKIPDQMNVTLLYNMLFMIATYIVECYNDVIRSTLVEFRKIKIRRADQ